MDVVRTVVLAVVGVLLPVVGVMWAVVGVFWTVVGVFWTVVGVSWTVVGVGLVGCTRTIQPWTGADGEDCVSSSDDRI